AVNGEGGGDLDVGAVEVGELLLPVGVFEIEEEGAERVFAVERLAAGGWNVVRRDFRARFRGLAGSAARTAAASEAAWSTGAAGPTLPAAGEAGPAGAALIAWSPWATHSRRAAESAEAAARGGIGFQPLASGGAF